LEDAQNGEEKSHILDRLHRALNAAFAYNHLWKEASTLVGQLHEAREMRQQHGERRGSQGDYNG
jgi:hypothetical protein